MTLTLYCAMITSEKFSEKTLSAAFVQLREAGSLYQRSPRIKGEADDRATRRSLK